MNWWLESILKLPLHMAWLMHTRINWSGVVPKDPLFQNWSRRTISGWGSPTKWVELSWFDCRVQLTPITYRNYCLSLVMTPTSRTEMTAMNLMASSNSISMGPRHTFHPCAFQFPATSHCKLLWSGKFIQMDWWTIKKISSTSSLKHDT
jgi:hypothetical protein